MNYTVRHFNELSPMRQAYQILLLENQGLGSSEEINAPSYFSDGAHVTDGCKACPEKQLISNSTNYFNENHQSIFQTTNFASAPLHLRQGT